MSDAVRFQDINRQCQHVAALIHEAQETTDPALSSRLYREARTRTATISGAVQASAFPHDFGGPSRRRLRGPLPPR